LKRANDLLVNWTQALKEEKHMGSILLWIGLSVVLWLAVNVVLFPPMPL